MEQATYVGNLYEYVLAIDGIGVAAPLRLRAQTAAHVEHAEGDLVAVAIEPARAVVVE